MKCYSIYFVFSCCMLITNGINAQHENYFKSDAGKYKLLADTTFTSIAQVTMLPGQKSSIHTHSAHFVYALTDGDLTVHYVSGETLAVSLKEGEYFLSPADGAHWTENTGKKAVKYLLVEFNDYPYMEMKTSMKQ